MAFNEELNGKTSATAMALARGGVGSSAESRTAVTYESFAKSLDRLLLCAPTCAAGPNVVSMFFNYGLYADHLAKFAKHFGWDRLLVERSEDFYADSATIALRVLRFAGLAVDDTLAVAMRQPQPLKGEAQRWQAMGRPGIHGQASACREAEAASVVCATQPEAVCAHRARPRMGAGRRKCKLHG